MRDARPPAIALRRRDVIPEAAVLVIGDDDEHVRPLRALLEMRDDVGDVRVAGQHVGIARMLVEIALRLVERDLRQLAGIDRLDELGAVQAAIAQMLGARRGARRVSWRNS